MATTKGIRLLQRYRCAEARFRGAKIEESWSGAQRVEDQEELEELVIATSKRREAAYDLLVDYINELEAKQ